MLKSKASWALSSAAAGVVGFREPKLIQAWDCIDTHVETIRSSRSIRKDPMLMWFVCTTNDGPELRLSETDHETQSWRLPVRRHGRAVGSRGQGSRRHKIGARRSSPRSFLGL